MAAAPIPVVSGVGHEIDVSLTDLAADLRALTPTDAAVQISPDGPQLAAAVATLGQRLQAGLDRRAAAARERIMVLASSRIFADPGRLVRDRRTTLDDQTVRLRRLAAAATARARERLAAAAGRLEAGSPLQLLARGWSVTFREGDPRTLRSVAGVEPGTPLVTQLTDGKLFSLVERIVSDA